MVMSEEEKTLTAYHEGGHALVAMNVPSTDPVHKATIIPRGRALGMVMQLPEQDKLSMTRQQMHSRLAILMGGRVAEEVVFGHDKVTSGASSDIDGATKLARAMVMRWGMSDKVGNIDYAEAHEGYQGSTGGFSVSAPTKELIESEVKRLIDEGYDRARKIILEKQEEVNGELNDADQIDVKIRHKPFSVYMRWHDDGQEVLYVEGENDNRLLAKPTKGFAAMSKKTWRLDPESKQATRNCWYPITTLGIENLLERVKEFYHSHVDAKDGIKCRVSETDLTGTIVRVYEVRFANPDVSPDYCHSRYYFEKKTGLLVGLENYCWNKEAESPLVEKYIYRKVNTQVHLNDSDFDESNPKYAFSD